LNHFYDPIFDRRLETPGLTLLDGDVHKNPDWAVGSFDSFADPNRPEPQRKNHFTVFDAREAMFRALTLLTYNGTGYPEIAAGRDIATRQQWRQAYWATTFRALGNVLHLNQDMAQPQHTRNEPHSGKPCPVGTTCFAGHTSIYEKYINARALQQNMFNSKGPFNVEVAIPIAPLPVTSYPIPAFANYSDYWSTAPGSPSLPGNGLADYSNRGFFTAAKNFDSTEYPYPSRDPARYQIASLAPAKWDGSAPTNPTPTKVYLGDVPDDWQQTAAVNVPLTTYSLWDQFVRPRTGAPVYSLNRLNYDAMASLLVPRAVAYSAGLINFFFRGRIDIELPDEGVFAAADHASGKGFTMVRTKIRNKTPDFFDRVRHRPATGHERRSVLRSRPLPQGQAILGRTRNDRGHGTLHRSRRCDQRCQARGFDAVPRGRRADDRVATGLRRVAHLEPAEARRIRVRRLANSARYDGRRAADRLPG
jgi:hypothetical protein